MPTYCRRDNSSNFVGSFGFFEHGCNSVLAIISGLIFSEFVLSVAGFGGGAAAVTLAVNGLTTTRPAATYSNVATTTAGTGSGLTLNLSLIHI